jgi:hypothetical protein
MVKQKTIYDFDLCRRAYELRYGWQQFKSPRVAVELGIPVSSAAWVIAAHKKRIEKARDLMASALTREQVAVRMDLSPSQICALLDWRDWEPVTEVSE